MNTNQLDQQAAKLVWEAPQLYREDWMNTLEGAGPGNELLGEFDSAL